MTRPNLYSMEQFAALFDLSVHTIRRDIESGVFQPHILNPGSKRSIYVLTDEDYTHYRAHRYATYNEAYPEIPRES